VTFRFDKFTFIKIRSHRRKFSNSDSVEQKKNYGINLKKSTFNLLHYLEGFIIVRQLQNVRQNDSLTNGRRQLKKL
jgi:hypothetical protein